MSESAHPRAHAAPPGGRGQRATRAFRPRHGVVSGSAARAGAAPPAFHTPRGSRQPRLHLHPARKVRTRLTPSFSEKVPACETWPHSDRLTASPRQPAANAPNALRGGGRRWAGEGVELASAWGESHLPARSLGACCRFHSKAARGAGGKCVWGISLVYRFPTVN